MPAVIGTDYKALGRMTEKKTGLPVLTIDTNGMDLYDRGQEKAWLALFKKFVVDEMSVEKGRVGIIGATPQDLSDLSAVTNYGRYLQPMVKRLFAMAWVMAWMR